MELTVLSREFILILYLLVLWSGVWKGVALWFAGKNQQKTWFIIMAIINTAGILEILYIFFFQKEPLCKCINKKNNKRNK